MYGELRKAMVESQLRPSGVNDVRVIAAMATVPRERFVPPERAALAYTDRPVPLVGGRQMNPPTVTGRLLTELRIAQSDRVLLIGAAGGYAAALLATLAVDVIAVEEDANLLSLAREALGQAGVGVTLVEGPLNAGHAAGAPYEVILIDGAVEQIPDLLVSQLASGGRLATGLIDEGVGRLALGRRAGSGFGIYAFEDSEAVRLPGFERVRAFTF